ncbi:MAG: YceI family protein [Cellvibrionaceae bacterium]
MKKSANHILIAFLIGLAVPAFAADYKIDTTGAHASINFKIPHLGYSFLIGRFDDFDGSFSYDAEKPDQAKIDVVIQVGSINSNHAERDKHLKAESLLHTQKFPEAKFTSTRYESVDAKSGKLHGNLTLRGITKSIVIEVTKVGEGKDPWGGYRAGFEGITRLLLKDFGIPMDLGPASREVELELQVEGVRQ